ncbi:MAG TPA: CDGSH iron-sulfur domain-containing protein [Leptolinea sp.]
MKNTTNNPEIKRRIVVECDGPIRVEGDIPLVSKIQIVSEYGEPLTWKTVERIPTNGEYSLCRCGHSKEFPFCDCTHAQIGFDGKETASTNTFEDRKRILPNGTGIVVKLDNELCMNSGFCGNRETNIINMMAQTKEPKIRAEIIAMIERCPAGAYTYAMREGEPDIEPDLPVQIAVTTDINSDGAVRSAFWVTGNIPIERADGQPFETRNRVTLCSCGESSNKPLCDGIHRTVESAKIK